MFESVRIVSSKRKEKKKNCRQENVLLLRKEGWETKVSKDEAKTWTFRNILSQWEAGSPLNVLGLLLMPPSARLSTQNVRRTTLPRSHRPISLIYCSKHIYSLPDLTSEERDWWTLGSTSSPGAANDNVFFTFSMPRQGLKAEFKFTHTFLQD